MIEPAPGSDGTDGSTFVTPFKRLVGPPRLGRLGTLGTAGALGNGRLPAPGRSPTLGRFGIEGTPTLGSDGTLGRPGTDGAFGTETFGIDGSAGAETGFCIEEESKLAFACIGSKPPPADTAPFTGPAGVLTAFRAVDADVALTATVTIAAANSTEYAMTRGFFMTCSLAGCVPGLLRPDNEARRTAETAGQGRKTVSRKVTT